MKGCCIMASIDGMIKAVNEHMDRVRDSLGIESNLYQRYSAFVTTALIGTPNAIKIDSRGHIHISREKNVEKNVKAATIEQIKEFMKANSLVSVKKRIAEDIKKGQKARGEKPHKPTIKEMKKKAESRLNATERFHQIVGFIYDNGNEPEAQQARKLLGVLKRKKGRSGYQTMLEIARLAEKMRNRMIKENQKFADYYVFEDMKGGNLFD